MFYYIHSETGYDRIFAVFFGPGPRFLDSKAFWDRSGSRSVQKRQYTGPDFKALSISRYGHVLFREGITRSTSPHQGLYIYEDVVDLNSHFGEQANIAQIKAATKQKQMMRKLFWLCILL